MQYWRYEGTVADELRNLKDMAYNAEMTCAEVGPAVWPQYALLVQDVAGGRLCMNDLIYLKQVFHKALYGYVVRG